MSEIELQSPLAGITRLGQRVLTVDGQSCTLSETPFIQMINLRGEPSQAAFLSAAAACIGLDLPLSANTVHANAERQVLWLGPDEWLIKLSDGQGEALESALQTALAGMHHAVVRVGDGNTTFLVKGAAAADLLARGCPLDLHPSVFKAGSVAQTHVAKAGATIVCVQAGEHFEMTVRRSFADYLYRWLCEAGD